MGSFRDNYKIDMKKAYTFYVNGVPLLDGKKGDEKHRFFTSMNPYRMKSMLKAMLKSRSFNDRQEEKIMNCLGLTEIHLKELKRNHPKIW